MPASSACVPPICRASTRPEHGLLPIAPASRQRRAARRVPSADRHAAKWRADDGWAEPRRAPSEQASDARAALPSARSERRAPLACRFGAAAARTRPSRTYCAGASRGPRGSRVGAHVAYHSPRQTQSGRSGACGRRAAGAGTENVCHALAGLLCLSPSDRSVTGQCRRSTRLRRPPETARRAERHIVSGAASGVGVYVTGSCRCKSMRCESYSLLGSTNVRGSGTSRLSSPLSR